MRANMEMYIQLHNRISNIVLELLDVQTAIENLYAAEKPDVLSSGSASGEGKRKKHSRSSWDSVTGNFSVAMVSDEIDADDISKFEDILRMKRDELT